MDKSVVVNINGIEMHISSDIRDTIKEELESEKFPHNHYRCEKIVLQYIKKMFFAFERDEIINLMRLNTGFSLKKLNALYEEIKLMNKRL